MHKTQAKIESMSTADWHQYHQLLDNRRVMDYFADEILRFANSTLKPDDVLRRFSLNGDGQLDLKEFQLAVKRLGIISFTADHGGSDGGGGGGDSAVALRKSKELFSVFCPSNNKKLDIDMFCRIMAEWSLKLLRAQQQLQEQRALAGGTGRHIPPIPTPYAIEAEPNDAGPNGIVSSEGEMIWRRIRESVVRNLEKLSQIFFKMDVTSSGTVSQEEFELAMSHIGVFLTGREYEKLYDALPTDTKDFKQTPTFGLRYAEFLASVQGKHPQAAKHTLPASAQTSSPPIAANARLWDLLVSSLDRLQPMIQQYERAQKRSVSAETFRDILMRCGITMSNPDYAALRVRLLSFTDPNGAVSLSALLHALQAHERGAMATSVRSSTAISGPGPTVSPIRTGRKTVFPTVSELMNASISSKSAGRPEPSTSGPHPAGKSNEQRNVEANRAIVKIRDESRWKSDLNFNPEPSTSLHVRKASNGSNDGDAIDSDDGHTNGGGSHSLERRILLKMQQLKDVGQLGASSPQTIFPGDRFNRITRGQFRQSLVHLGVLARYAEVENLFWALDPNGRGYIVTQDLYDHLNTMSTRLAATSTSQLPEIGQSGPIALGARLPRSVQKIFEGMLLQAPQLLAICQRADSQRTGTISRPELIAAIHELGILASPQDVQTAIMAITQRVEFAGSGEVPPYPESDAYHPHGIVYSRLEKRLTQLCSDLLSPKRRRQHLTTASVLLAPQEEPAPPANGKVEFNMNICNETDTLWNCPRRRMNQDHRAMKSSIKISDQVYDDCEDTAQAPSGTTSEEDPASHDGLPGDPRSPRQCPRRSRAVADAVDKHKRGRRVAMIDILQDLLERRGELKCVMDLHRNADVHGQVSKRDLVEIFMASRLNLNFSGTASGITAPEFVDVLYPQPEHTVSFLDLLHRISDLLAELTRVTPLTTQSQSGLYGNNAYPRHNRRLHTGNTRPPDSAPYSPIVVPDAGARTTRADGHVALFASDELSLQRKLLFESRLQDLLTSESGLHSAAILIRHAYKGVMARELVVPIENGEFEAVCRTSDLKHVCYRLGLDLDVGELHFLISSIDVNQSGYVSSPQLLQFFVHLATRSGDKTARSRRPTGIYSSSPLSPRLETNAPPLRQHAH